MNNDKQQIDPIHVNNIFMRVYKLPYNDKIHSIEDKIYGYCYRTNSDRNWFTHFGSFDFVFGLFLSLGMYFEMQEHIASFNNKMDEDSDENNNENEVDSFDHVFFQLDQNNMPIEIINNIRLTPKQLKKIGRTATEASIIYNITSIPEEDVPTLEFNY